MSTYPALTAELLRRGYKDDEIKKILGQNMLRVMREVEKVSKRLQAERGPSTMLFEPSERCRARSDRERCFSASRYDASSRYHAP